MGTTPLYLNQRSHAASDPIRNFRFIVKFIPPDDGLQRAVKFSPTLGFMAVSGLALATEAIPYREGGFNTTVHYLPGQQSFAPVTLQRGVNIGSDQHWRWFQQLFDVGYGKTDDQATLTGNFRCSVDISVLAHPQPLVYNQDAINDDPVVQRFGLMNAWITNISYSDLNAADSGVLVEQITLVHEGLSIRWPGKPSIAQKTWYECCRYDSRCVF
jgi:phage tail-like protein